jgi:hypothetical protein
MWVGRASVRISHRINCLDVRHRVSFGCDNEGHWSYEIEDQVRKRWRKRPHPNTSFQSYAAALVDAQSSVNWIANAVEPHSWHVELLRGRTFHFAEHSAEYDAHDHCVSCMLTLTAPESGSGTEHCGFVTRFERPDGSGSWQWKWVCTRCFEDLREPLQWQFSEPL